LKLAVRVIPNAPRTGVTGRRGEEIVLRVNAPPIDGRANKAALEHLAEAFDVPPSSIRLIRGERSRHKTFEIDGVDQAALAPLLEMLLANRDRDSPGTLLSEDD
jgi:uncharacterized protein (TIGR00251 family)